jgi:hypothetical protein
LNFLETGHQIDWSGWSRAGHDQTGHKSLKTRKNFVKNKHPFCENLLKKSSYEQSCLSFTDIQISNWFFIYLKS